jgi:hypothetical protein
VCARAQGCVACRPTWRCGEDCTAPPTRVVAMPGGGVLQVLHHAVVPGGVRLVAVRSEARLASCVVASALSSVWQTCAALTRLPHSNHHLQHTPAAHYYHYPLHTPQPRR